MLVSMHAPVPPTMRQRGNGFPVFLCRVGVVATTTILSVMASGCARDEPNGGVPAGTLGVDRAGSGGIDSISLASLVDSVMAAGMKQEGIPGAVFVLVQDGRVLLAAGYGKADVAEDRPVRVETTLFPIASITKVFTATAVMQLADRGALDLHTDVNAYLRSLWVPAMYAQPMTAGHLLSHTAGLDELPGRRVDSSAHRLPLEDFLRDRLIRVHPPGEVTSYSSYGMALAGLLIEDVSGLPFEEYLRRAIWQPLGMHRTFITVPDSLEPDLATAYELEDDELVPVTYEVYQTPPASSVVSTAQDMARFMIAHLAGGRYGETRILSDRATVCMHRQQATMHRRVPGWSFGFQLDDTNGRRILEHGGDIGGFSSLLTLLPDEGVGFFVVHHLEGTDLRFEIRRSILDRFYPDERNDAPLNPSPDSSAALRRFAGTYRANIFCHSCSDAGPNVQDFEVEANDDGTITVWDQRWVPVSPLYFVSLDDRRRIGFAEDESGRIAWLTGGLWRVLERIR